MKVGSSILHTVATDIDAEKNARVTYTLEDPSGFFIIDEKSGWIEIAKEITGVRPSVIERGKDRQTDRQTDMKNV